MLGCGSLRFGFRPGSSQPSDGGNGEGVVKCMWRAISANGANSANVQVACTTQPPNIPTTRSTPPMTALNETFRPPMFHHKPHDVIIIIIVIIIGPVYGPL